MAGVGQLGQKNKMKPLTLYYYEERSIYDAVKVRWKRWNIADFLASKYSGHISYRLVLPLMSYETLQIKNNKHAVFREHVIIVYRLLHVSACQKPLTKRPSNSIRITHFHSCSYTQPG